MKITQYLLSLCLCFLLIHPNAKAETKTIILSHLNSNTVENATGVMATTFKRILETDEALQIDVEIFPEGQLGSDQHVVRLVQEGVIQSAIVTLGGVAPIFPEIGVLNVPFLFGNLDEAYRSFDGRFGEAVAERLKERTGLHILGYGDSGGLFVLTNSKRPIHSVRDMEGLTIRTMNLEGHKTVINNLGAKATPIAWGELFSALRSKAIDGQMNPPSIIRLGNLDQVQTYMTVTNHLYTPYFWVANSEFLDGLSPQQMQVIKKAAREAVLANRDFNAKTDAMEELERSMEVHYPTPRQLNGFKIYSLQKVENFLTNSLGEEGLKLLRIARGQYQ